MTDLTESILSFTLAFEHVPIAQGQVFYMHTHKTNKKQKEKKKGQKKKKKKMKRTVSCWLL